MAEPFVIITTALTSAVNAAKAGKQTYDLLPDVEDAPEHIQQLSEHLSSFNTTLISFHTAIAQEAAKFDHDPLTISQLECLPPLLNHGAKQMASARSILGSRDSQWETYRKDDLMLMSKKLQDYASALTLGLFGLTMYGRLSMFV